MGDAADDALAYEDRCRNPRLSYRSHPIPQKEPVMTTENERARELAVETIERMQALIAEIDAKNATPPEPEPGTYSVTLRFKGTGSYTYVFLKTATAKGWYSTAQIGSGHFNGWEELWRWMNRKQVVWRSEFRRMVDVATVIPASDAS